MWGKTRSCARPERHLTGDPRYGRRMGRRKVALEDDAAWVFNRMADVYDARPPYPATLVDEIVARTSRPRARAVDFAAGTGHLALPLAARGLEVLAIEPARAMLAQLLRTSAARRLPLSTLHATAESAVLEARSCDLVTIADAVHFLDAELTGKQIARVLRPGGAVALVTCAFARTAFMDALTRVMEESAPRRPRPIAHNLTQLLAVADVRLAEIRTFEDHTPVDHSTLELILRSISYIGPAMNRERFENFRRRVFALSHTPVWSRSLSLLTGFRA